MNSLEELGFDEKSGNYWKYYEPADNVVMRLNFCDTDKCNVQIEYFGKEFYSGTLPYVAIEPLDAVLGILFDAATTAESEYAQHRYMEASERAMRDFEDKVKEEVNRTIRVLVSRVFALSGDE